MDSMSPSSSSSTATRPNGFSFEMKMFRCHSVVDGTVAFCGRCQQQRPTVAKPAQGRGSWNYIYSSEKIHAGIDQSCLSSLCSDGGRTGESLQFSGESSHRTSASPSTSPSAYRVSTSSSSSSGGSSNGSQSSSLHSPDTEEGRPSGCGGWFRAGRCDNGNRKPLDVKVTSTIGTSRKQGNTSYDSGALKTAFYGGGSGTRSLVRGGLSAPGKTFNSLVLTYLERTSAHALPRVARSRGRVRRILWIGTFVFFVGYFVYQLAALLDMFYSYPVGATIYIEQRRVIDFPAVTVCNLNVMKSSRLVKDPRYRNISGIDKRFKKEAEKLLNNRVDPAVPKGVRTNGIPAGDGAPTPVTPDGDPASPDKETRRQQGRRRLNASNFRGVERQIAEMMKKIRRSRSNDDGDRTIQKRTPNTPMGDDSSGRIDFRKITENNVRRRGGRKLSTDDSANDRNDDLVAVESPLPPTSANFDYEESGFSSVSNDYEFDELMAQSTSSDYSDLYQLLKPTSEDLERYGHQPEDFLAQCSFDTKNCSHRDFYRRVSPFFGNCYTFNHRMNGMPSRTSSKYGSRYGLRLTLNIEHDEYLGLFSPKAGVRVAVHPYNVTPFPEDVGLDAMPGCETEIGVTVEAMKKIYVYPNLTGSLTLAIVLIGILPPTPSEAIKRVPHPHPSNCTNRKRNVHHSGDDDIYTVLSCSKHCLQRKLEQFCGCVDGEVTSVNDSIVRCVSTNSTQEKCRQLVRHFYENNQQQCDCPPACEELIYKTTVSSAMWPSQPYANLLASVLFEDKTFTDMTEVYNSIRSNLVSVHVYLTDMNIRRIEEYPSYPWDRLLADIGGMLGLFIGISACTAVEVVEFLVDAVLLAVTKCRFGVERRPTVRFATSAISTS